MAPLYKKVYAVCTNGPPLNSVDMVGCEGKKNTSNCPCSVTLCLSAGSGQCSDDSRGKRLKEYDSRLRWAIPSLGRSKVTSVMVLLMSQGPKADIENLPSLFHLIP